MPHARKEVGRSSAGGDAGGRPGRRDLLLGAGRQDEGGVAGTSWRSSRAILSAAAGSFASLSISFSSASFLPAMAETSAWSAATCAFCFLTWRKPRSPARKKTKRRNERRRENPT
ncbi:MAG TPA: hypothetical protein PKA62_02710 [Thermoanaerobaculia bacterium]|nr:hypothetical protein [Thermoanaerobaculia bacterium]